MNDATPRPSTVTRFRPSAADLVDLAFAAVLSALAVVGFRSSFGESEELVIGLPAVVAGTLVAYVLAKMRLPMLVTAALAALAFFLLGGALALRDDAVAGIIPTPEVWTGLIDGCINGWARLLTSVPPAPPVGNLRAIPYLAGYLGALLAVLSAFAWPRAPICVVPPAVVLAVTVLFGVEEPVSLLLQGALFGGLVVAWLSLRVRRTSPALVAGGRRRALAGAAMVGVVVAGALVVGPGLPGANAHDRYLLREQIDPPFDPSQYPSPLARFRDFHGEKPIEEPLFTVDGLPPGELVRFAVMDDYDGYVWRASPPGSVVGGTYQRVGDEVPGAAEGSRATVRFEMGSLAEVDSVWIPTAGSPASIRFEGSRSEILTEEFRFNRATETAASPVALAAGDRWVVDAAFPEAPSDDRLQALPILTSAQVAAPEGITDSIANRIAEWTKGKGPFESVVAIEDALKDIGAYNDGKVIPVPAGHGLARLVPFLDAVQPQGNGEQYAAAVAFAARSIGIPARVVLEFGPFDDDGRVEVRAADARAAVEIALAGEGWVRLPDPTPPESDVPTPQVSQNEPPPRDEVQPPPPVTRPLPNTLLEERLLDREVDLDDDAGARDGLLGALVRIVGIAAIPVALLLVPALAVIVLKARRRARRRTRGSPSDRITAGWAEVLDVARDVGTPVPPTATRREWARLTTAATASGLASAADRWVFGANDATDADAESVWAGVDTVRLELVAPLSRWQRVKAAMSPTSLRALR